MHVRSRLILGSADLVDGLRGGGGKQEGNGMHLTATGQGFGAADNLVHRPVAAFDQHVRLDQLDQLGRGVAVKPGHQADAFQCGQHGGAVLLVIDGPVLALALTLDRGIGIQPQHQAGAQGAGLRQVGDMTAMQDVETAIGEHDGTRQCRQSLCQLFRRADLVFECRCGIVHSIIMTSIMA